MKKAIALVLFVIVSVEISLANLRPIYLSIELRPASTAANTKNIIQWNVVFTNLDSIRHAIVLVLESSLRQATFMRRCIQTPLSWKWIHHFIEVTQAS
jgi:hypothetical protein